MGILKHGDLFSTKYLNAEIDDGGNRMYIIWIKNTIGDYFLATINREEYLFKIEGSRIKTHRNKLQKSFQVIRYDISHYLPIASKEYTEIEKILRESNLPNIDTNMFSVLKILGSREKKPFRPHNLSELIDELNKRRNDKSKGIEYREAASNLINYLEGIKADKIVTPVKRISEFLEGDLMTTDAKFLGSIASSLEKVDYDHKKITNAPQGPKNAWIKWVALIALIGIVAGVAVWAWQSGTFSHILPSFDNPGTPQDIMTKYKTPEALKAAIDRGEIKLESLPPDIQRLVENVKPPVVTPIP